MSKNNYAPFVIDTTPDVASDVENPVWGAFYATVTGEAVQAPAHGWVQTEEGVIVPLVEDHCYGGGFVSALKLNGARMQYVEVRPFWESLESFEPWVTGSETARFGSASMFAALRFHQLQGDEGQLVRELSSQWAPQDVIGIVANAAHFGLRAA